MDDCLGLSSAEETLVGTAVGEDGKSKDVLLRSRVDPSSGGLCWLPVDASVAAEGVVGRARNDGVVAARLGMCLRTGSPARC